MKKIFDRLTALVMVMLMFIQSCVPAITSFAKEEELDKRYVIQKLETLKQDTYANFSLNLATVIDDKNLDSDSNVKFVLNATDTNSNIKLLVRKDFSLYDERTFDTVEEAHKEFDRVDKSLKDQGLSLDVSVVQEGEKYRIHNNYVPQADKENFGDDYKVYSLKVVPEFDFDKEGLYNKLPENDKTTEQHRLQLAEERRLQQDGEVPENKHNRTYIFDFKVDKAVDTKLTTIALNKDENNPLEVKQTADLFAAILDDKTYSTYQTEQLPAEVTSSIEHKNEVAKAKAEADAKAKAEADAKAKAEADEKAKKEAEEKVKADAKAKEEADAKAKAEADKKKAEEAKKTEEQKALDEKAKQEADAKAKAEADAKAKAEAEKLKAEAKAKQEQLAEEQAEAEAQKAAEEKAKKDLENKKLLGLEKDTEENQEEEPIIKKKETTEEVKSEPATPEERKQKAEEFDKALKERKEEIKKSEDKKDANNKEDNKKTTDKKEVSKETKGLLEGIKEFFGFSNLQKADRELKAILSVKANGLKEVQALLSSFEDKYHLTQQEQAKLMDDNKDAIKALIEKDADKNFNPQMLLANSDQGLENKKFTIRTRFDTSTRVGPIKTDQFFNIHLDDKLTVKNPSELKPIYNGNTKIAEPKYDKDTNTIKYKIVSEINENLQIPLNIPVDYNTKKISDSDFDNNGLMTITNSVSGLGVTNPKNLVPQKIDKDGNPAGSIIEPGRDDVVKIVDDKNGNYQVPIDITGDPVIENGEMVGINWNMRVRSEQSLNALGFVANFTTVEGSGLGEISKVLLNGKEVTATDQLENALGIVDSKHHKVTNNIQDASYSFYTKVTNKQEKYMIDVSVFLKQKEKTGAVRFILDQGWPKEKVEEATPTRVGINNRTTIQGKFLANDKAQWTITDAISSGDEGNSGMPLADRTLDGGQTVKSGKSAVYGLDAEGKMVQIGKTKENLSEIPTKESDPKDKQAVGNIAVYQLDTRLTNSDQPNNYNISGVRISKFKDLYIDQVWNFPEQGMTMPGQYFIANDNNGNELGKVHVEEGTAGQNTRFVTIPNARYWDIDEKTHEPSKRGNKIEQKFDTDTVEVNGKTYKYNENANYYQTDTKRQYIHNSAIDTTKPKPVTFTVVKVDSKDPSKKLAGATFKLLGDGNPSIVTDDQGKATFNNVLPGRYTLIEEKAPAGYKLDESQKTITIAEDGTISVNGSNIQSGGSTSATKLVHHNSYPNWPDYMNAMHYGKINDNGELEFYLYLKPESNNGKDGTNRDTRLNISIPGVNITEVKAYDVSPGYRQNVKYSMEQQKVDGYIPSLGNNVINAANNNKIIGTPNKQDPYTGKTGYEINFPQQRFANDWGFLVKVKAKVGDKQSVSLDYDWLTTENTANQTKLTQSVILNKTNGQGTGEKNQILVTNEEFAKSPISATKFGDTFNADGNRERLQGAEFVLKDSKNNVIANKFTDKNGTADFGQFPPGTYRLEEKSAPDGYQKNGVYFEVVVDEQGQVTYKAKFEDGIGTPQVGQDYYIEKGEETESSAKAKVTSVNQRLEYLENEPGDIGTKTGVWEAYSYESLKYHADVTLTNVSEGSRFEIQFDRNLDFTQYFSAFPKIKIDGVEVADPYFDYNTNLLTYVFNDKAKKDVTASINLRGIIPDKYFARETGKYTFTIKVATGGTKVDGNPVLNQEINADYGRHHSGTGDSNQSYYFRDVYQKEDGKWYVTVLTYLNPLGEGYSTKTVRYNWLTTDFQNNRIAEWSGKGHKPLYELNDVKVYGTEYAKYWLGDLPLNSYMPLSMGIRPEQDPNIYHLLAHQAINPASGSERTQNGIYINYNPANIKTNEKLATEAIGKAPLIVKVPRPKDKGGYVVEQTFKITDIDQFNKKWRAFYMYDGNLTSAFASKANVNTAKGDQSGGEIPKYYKEVIGLINNKYTPGSFKLTKYDETNQEKKLQNATFVLTDDNGKTIFRTSDANGEVNFKDIAPGRYTLEETRPPEGYQLTNKKWQVTVLSDGSVRIRETSITGAGQLYTGNEINIPVSNKPAGEKFRVYKKDGNGQPLPGAKFKITDPDDSKFLAEATSGPNGIVEFEATLTEGKNYILEEAEPPTGYNQLNKKWVLRVEDGKTKVYNYSEKTGDVTVEKSLLGDKGTEWVDVKNRDTSSWSNYDNRWTGWVDNNQNAEHLGTRIIAINKDKKYVIQRYVINPEAKNIDAATAATIHREKPEYQNMDWYAGTEDVKIFTLEPKTGGNTDGKVTGLISDIRLASYTVADITDKVKKSTDKSHFGETRLKLDLPATKKPIVVDVKVPYKDENGGVGTGMDWREAGTTYWKSDYYERVSDIKTSGLVSETGGTIVGSYVAEGSLDVTNSLKTYGFKIKKVKEVKEGETKTTVPGAVFKLTGPDPLEDERFETTNKNGMLAFNGLKPGTYKLEEFKSAPGYQKTDTTWTVRVANDGKVYIKDNGDNTKPPEIVKDNLEVVRVNNNPSANRIRQHLAQNSTSLYGVDTGLEFGPEMVEAALRAGEVTSYEILNTSSDKQTKQVKVDTDAQYLGNDEFLVRIDVKGNANIDCPDVTFNLKLHNDVEFVPNSTTTWKVNANDKDQAPNNPSRWHTGYDFNTKTIGVKGGAISINKGDTASIEFKVKLVKNLNTNGTADIFQDYKVYGQNVTKPRIKKIEAYTINKKAQNGTIITNPIDAQRSGQPVTFTAKPNPGYKLVGNVTVTNNENGRDIPISNGNTFTMPNSDVTINASFEAETYKITYNKPTGGSVNVPETAKTDKNVIINVNPESGYKLKSLTVDGQDVTNKVVDNKYTFTMPPRNVSVKAEFEKIEEKTYEVTPNVQENGTVTADPNQNIKAGKTVTLTLSPKTTDYVLKKLEVNSGTGKKVDTTKVDDNTYTFKMPESNVGVNVYFEKKQAETYSITVNPSQNGSVTADKQTAKANDTVKLTVTPEEGFEIEGVTMNGQALKAGADGKYSFTMPAGGATVSATFKKSEPQGPQEGETEIEPGEAVQITNEQVGLDLKIYKKDRYDRKLEGAIFNIRKTDEDYKTFDDDFGVKTGTSNKEGLVEFKDKDGNKVNLPVGYYVIEETAAPLGYRKANAPWKVEVVEENGQLVAKYKGPEKTPQSFVENNKNLEIKNADGVKYATKITHIDTESRTFIQRVYIDTRKKDGVVNVQINPKHKREEIDRAGLPPVTIKEGVKTAYRSTYKITGIDGDPNEAQMIKILNDYDVSNPNVTVVNTAKWRPFDWGFDEDQLNLEPGVYYIDIEGFYDTSIIDRNVTNEVAIDSNYNFTKKDGVTPSDEPVLKNPYVNNDKKDLPDADLGKIDIDIKFYDGAREFQQSYITENRIIDYKAIKDENGKDEASYQNGAEALRQYREYYTDTDDAKKWAKSKPARQKYANYISKEVKINEGGNSYKTGKIVPTIDTATPSSTISTSMDISSLYSSQKENTVPQEGLSIENDAERYNITFSKHGKETDKDSIEEITKRRLEGAVFKLEKRVREGIYEEVEGSYVSSAFNGYFGFRGLEPGRYRLIEVQAPKGYKPIEGPLLHFSVETVSIVSQRIVDPRTGESINVNTTKFYFPDNTKEYKFEDLKMHDPVTNEVIKFKDAKNVDLETTRIINPLDETKEVPLRDLSIKFPDVKNSANEVLIPAKTYKISEIQITPSSNGYISLEYDKANGVYQYIPEKSTTEENGLLVDYVTSATAKNMGKIVNEKPGKGSVTINKVDEHGNALKGTANKKGELIAGAKFRLTNLTDGSTPVEKIVGTDGNLTFEGLKIGNYKLEEIESPDGHINTGQVWHFTVGGKELDPYSEDIAPTGRDLSGQIKLTESKMNVVSPINKNGAPTVKGEIHPHLGESLVFDNSYKVPEGIKINPGDYFTLKLKDSTDIHGIFENPIDNLDIFADGVGTIAKANYNRKAGTITYTFTKYADTYELKNISNKIAAFINLDVIRQSQNFVDVGFIDKTSKVNVVYDLKTERKNDGVNFINYTSKIVKYNPDTGEFVHYFYINRDRTPTGAFDFNFLSEQNLSNIVVTEYKVLNNLENAMPESFGVNENSNNLGRGRVINSSNYLPAGRELTTPYYNGVTRDGSYIVKVTGKVADKDKDKYVGHSNIIHYYGNGYVLYADRFDAVYGFVNESSAEAKLTIKAINPSNKIKFKKINSKSEALQGATFQLYKKNNEGKWNSYGQPIKTKEDGLIEYSKLPKGEYQLKETTAPTGYVTPDGPLAEFKVDESGKVFRKEFYKDEKGQTQEKYVEEPGVVPITLVNNKENEIVFKKVDGTDETKVLKGAEFEVLYKEVKDAEYKDNSITLYKDDKGTIFAFKADDNKPTGLTKVDGNKLTSGEDGLVKFKVRSNGYYALKETKAPSGYLTPKDFVKEFAVLDDKVQTEQHKTEMDVKKTTGSSMANDVFQKSYTTNMTLRFNPNHEDITYVKDKSTITLSDLPLKSEIWDNSFNGKQPMSITAYLVDNDNNESTTKTYTLDLTKDYNSGTKASKTIDLYSLVKELENPTADGDIKSNKTLVLSMSSSLYLKSELDIKSNIVIGDKIKEDRTFHIGTKGDDYVEHSYSFTTMGELTDLGKNPIQVENYKATFPHTGAMGIIGFIVVGVVMMATAYYKYRRKRRESALS